MNVTNTGIAVAVALAVVAAFFIFPGLSPFGAAPQASDLSVTQDQSAPASSTTVTAATNPNATTMTTPDGLQITDTVVGTGATAEAGDVAVVQYTGQLADGTVFDSSVGKPAIVISPCPAGTQTGLCFTVGGSQVIQGWDEGVAGMKVGGTRILVIPPALGYGAAGVPGVIPANATLTFQVELLAVGSAQ